MSLDPGAPRKMSISMLEHSRRKFDHTKPVTRLCWSCNHLWTGGRWEVCPACGAGRNKTKAKRGY